MTDDTDFAGWIRPHLGVLMRISRAFAPPADQNDLMQELLLSVWKARPAFRGDSSAATFIYRVAHNRALTWKRREGLRALSFLQARPQIVLFGGNDNDGSTDERLEALYAAIRQLPPVDRSLVVLSLEGVPYAEMSALLGMSESHVGARLSRARTRLVTLVAEACHGF